MLIDSHCHLDLEQFDADRVEVLFRAQAADIGAVVIPAIDLGNASRVVALAEASAGGFDGTDVSLYAAVGVHPNSAATWHDDPLDTLRTLVHHPRVVAIGEIGLDNYWKEATPAEQERALWAQLELAAEVSKPVIIHNREATEALHAILRQWVQSDAFRASPLAQRPFAGVLHAFGGTIAEAEEAYGWGFALSMGGPVTFRNARNLHALVPELRLDRLMLETDAPYLTPHPHRGKRNEPGFLALVCRQIAELRGISPEEVATATTEVARTFFNLRDTGNIGGESDRKERDLLSYGTSGIESR